MKQRETQAPDCDPGAIRRAVKERYAAVASTPAGHFAYPVGEASARNLAYTSAWIDAVPSEIRQRFIGVGNPFSAHAPRTGASVLDVGCGSGFDCCVAALLVGAHGRAIGIDLSAEMLGVGRRALAGGPLRVELVEASVEQVPFGSGSFDQVISNGVLNLVPDKDRAYREIHRVLRAGGVFTFADLLVVQDIPDEVLAQEDAWST